MSEAVGLERISKVVGYKIEKGSFQETSPNLPQRIAIFAEANIANQGGLDLTGREITSAQQAGNLYGFGSPIYTVMRILRPLQGEGVGGIPTFVFPQAEAGGAAEKILEITPTGTATANGTHTIKLAGRNGIDGVFYDINIVVGDTVSIIATKIQDALNAVVGCPVIGSTDVTPDRAVLTAKWKGLTSDQLSVSVDLNDTTLGITYAIASTASGSGTPSVQAALDQFGNDWFTIVVNSYVPKVIL